jgi:hypothetical protein
MTVISMSDKEFSRLQVLQDVAAGRLKIGEAAALLQLTRRQFFRIQRGFRQNGPEGLVSKRRGRTGNHRSPASIRKYALSCIREWYADFGPTLATEKLAECHGLALSRETIRKWMMAEGLWLDRNVRSCCAGTGGGYHERLPCRCLTRLGIWEPHQDRSIAGDKSGGIGIRMGIGKGLPAFAACEGNPGWHWSQGPSREQARQ